LEYVEKFRHAAAEQGSGVQSDFDLHTPQGFGGAMAFGMVHVLFAPFPWQMAGGSFRMLLVAPETVFWWWLFFTCVAPGMWYGIRHRFADVQPLLFFIVLMGLLYSLMFSNVGLVYRQRAQLLPWFLIFAAAGWELRLMRRRAPRAAEGTGL